MTPVLRFTNDPVRLGIYVALAPFVAAALGSIVLSVKDGFDLSEAGGLLFMDIGLLLVAFAIQAVIAFSGCALVWRVGRASTPWTSLDRVVVVVPWSAWALLMMASLLEKSEANFAVEPFLVGCAAPLAALVRLWIGRVVSQVWATGMSIVLGLSLALGVYWVVPVLPV